MWCAFATGPGDALSVARDRDCGPAATAVNPRFS